MAFLGRFGRHTFALKGSPRPEGVRFGHFGALKTLAVGGVNASERGGERDRTLANAAATTVYLTAFRSLVNPLCSSPYLGVS